MGILKGKSMFKKILLAVTLSSCFGTCLAEYTEYSGVVTRFYINQDKDVMIGMSNSALNTDCFAGGGMQVKFSADPATTPMAKEWISMFLSARVSGQAITIGVPVPSPASRCIPSVVYL